MSLALGVIDALIAETADVASKALDNESTWRELAKAQNIRHALESGVSFRLGVLREVRQAVVTAEIERLEKAATSQGAA